MTKLNQIPPECQAVATQHAERAVKIAIEVTLRTRTRVEVRDIIDNLDEYEEELKDRYYLLNK